MLSAEDLAILATHPSFFWSIIAKKEQSLECFSLIDDVLNYENSDEQPQCFRPFKILCHFGGTKIRCLLGVAEYGGTGPRSTANGIELSEDKDAVWVVEPASTGKTLFGLWLGHHWRLRHPHWVVMYLDARYKIPSEEIQRRLSEDIKRARRAPLFLIFDNLQAWHENAAPMWTRLPIPAGSKCVCLARPASGIEMLKKMHEEKYGDRFVELTISTQTYTEGVITKYIQQNRTDLLNERSFKERCGTYLEVI